MVVKAVSLTEFKRNLGEMVDRAGKGHERIILLSRGKPKAAVISLEDLRVLEDLEQSPERQLALLEEARALREKIASRLGEKLPDSVELLRELREERIDELMGLR